MRSRFPFPSRHGPLQDEHRIMAPLATHWGTATCEDVDCVEFLSGWKLILSVEGQPDYIAFIRSLKNKDVEVAPGRKHRYWFTEERIDLALVEFLFPAGQPCFKAAEHKAQNGRPALFLRRIGGREPQVLRPQYWEESLHEMVDKAVELLKEQGG